MQHLLITHHLPQRVQTAPCIHPHSHPTADYSTSKSSCPLKRCKTFFSLSLFLSFQSDVDRFLVKHHTDIVNESSPSWGSTGILSCKAEQLPVPNTSGLSYLFFPSVPSFIVPSKVSLCMYFSHVQHSNYGLSRCCVVFSPAKVLSSVVWRSSSWFYRGSYCVSLPRWEEHYQNRPFKLFSFLSRHLKELSDI